MTASTHICKMQLNHHPPAAKRSTELLANISLGLLVVFIVARLMVSGLSQEASIPSVNKVIELFAALSLLFWILSGPSASRMLIVRTGLRIPILAFALLTVLSIAQASYVFAAASTAFTWIVHICVFFLVVNLCADEKRYRIVLTTVIATAVAVSIFALYQYFYELDFTRRYYQMYPSEFVVQASVYHDLMSRLYRDEAFGTFLLSNMLGGYLVMVIPLLLFLVYGSLRRCRLNTPAGFVVLLGGAACALSLYLSGSKGAWLAILTAAALFGTACWVYRQPPQKRRKAALKVVIVLAVAAVLVIAIMLAAGFDSLPDSAQVRLGYWDASIKMIARNPFGVGLSNFEENYPIYQAPWATEVRKPHNSYLAIWSELGIAGLTVFLLILILAARRYIASLRIKPVPPDSKELAGGTGRQDNRSKCNRENVQYPEREGSLGLPGSGNSRLELAMLLAGLAGFILIALLRKFGNISLDPRAIGLVSLSWVALAAALLLTRSRLSGSGQPSLASAGIAVGLLAFCCHAFIDFDFHSHGINATFWVLLGLLLTRSRLREPKRKPEPLSKLGISAGALLIIIILLFGALYIPHALEADNVRKTATILAEDAARAHMDPVLAEGAAKHFEEAQKLSHWHAQSYQGAAELYENIFARTGKRHFANMALKNYTAVIKRRSKSHFAYSRRGLLKMATGGSTAQGARKAVADIEKAVQLHPVKAHYRYMLGCFLLKLASLSDTSEAAKLKARARQEFLEALRLHSVACYRRGKLPGAQLKDIKQHLNISPK